jgi:magnesium transporter
VLAFPRRVSLRGARRAAVPADAGPRPDGVRAFLYDADGEDGELALEAIDLDDVDESGLLWLDVSDREQAEHATRALGLEPGTGSSLAQAPARTDLAFHPRYVRISVVVARRTEHGYEPTSFHCLVGENWLATVHEVEIDFLERFSERIRGDSGLGQLDAPGLAAVFLHEHIASYLREVEPLELDLDQLDVLSISGRADGDQVLRRLVAVRRRLAQLRRLFAPHRELYGRLALPDFELLSESATPEAYASLSERSEQALQTLDTTREMILNSFDIYTTWTAHATNRVMRLLTVASVALLPATLIASVMGMNSLPTTLASPQAFSVTLGAMCAVSGTVVGAARLRGWL